MNYHQKLGNVIAFIGKHVDEELSLESLSDIFGVSKFHFHRLFTAFTGLSLQQYIRWLRLKRAAYQLIVDKDESIINIAINAGFGSHEAFSRAFKRACGMSPSQFRVNSTWSSWDKSPCCLPERGRVQMKVEFQNIDQIRLAVIEHRGDPEFLAQSLNKLVSWAKAQTINLKPNFRDAFGIAYDDPKTTPPAEFRFDLGIKVPENLNINNGIIEKYIPSGRYAVAL